MWSKHSKEVKTSRKSGPMMLSWTKSGVGEFCEGGGGGVVGGSIATEQNADSPTSSRERLSRGSPRTRSRINK